MVINKFITNFINLICGYTWLYYFTTSSNAPEAIEPAILVFSNDSLNFSLITILILFYY